MATATGFYDVADKLKEILLGDENVNTVTYGDITKVATNKTTIYPLSHSRYRIIPSYSISH